MIDDQSEPGSWGKHLRETEQMRQQADPFAHSDNSREARPICDCQRSRVARIHPNLSCNGMGKDCQHSVIPSDPPARSYKVMGAVYKPQERAIALLIDGGVIPLSEAEAENIYALIGHALETRDRAIGFAASAEAGTGKE